MPPGSSVWRYFVLSQDALGKTYILTVLCDRQLNKQTLLSSETNLVLPSFLFFLFSGSLKVPPLAPQVTSLIHHAAKASSMRLKTSMVKARKTSKYWIWVVGRDCQVKF